MHQPLHWTVNHKENYMASLTIHFWAPSCQDRALPWRVLCKCFFEQSDHLRLFIKKYSHVSEMLKFEMEYEEIFFIRRIDSRPPGVI